MVVKSFDPRGSEPEITADALARLRAAAARLDEPAFGLTGDEAEALAPLLRLPAERWQARVADLADDALVALIRLFTLGEMAFSSWEAGARSPVIPLAAALKARGAWPPDLTAWIKANTSNRFLPYGSLLDRL